MFSDELKGRTALVHAELEKKLIPHIRKVADKNGYAKLLGLMGGFYLPLQKRLEPWLGQEGFDGHYRGRQAENILKDLDSMGYTSSSLSICSDLPEIDTYARALGALYVTEGSTLGGQIIINMLARQTGENLSGSDQFFNAYGPDTKKVWENFKEKLNQPLSESEREELIQSAENTFSSFKQWILNYESGIDQ